MICMIMDLKMERIFKNGFPQCLADLICIYNLKSVSHLTIILRPRVDMRW